MNRLDVIAKVAEDIDMPRSKVAEVLDAVLGAVEASLKAGQEVRLTGFGSFSTSVRKASTGRNPRTGEAMAIGESTSVRFKPGKALKDAVG